MGGRTPETGSHLGRPTPGSKSRNPTHCDTNPVTHNTTKTNSTSGMEKPSEADQHQRPISPLGTSAGEPTTPKPRTNAPTTETPSGTHDARDEAAAGAAQTPRIPKATNLWAGDGTRGEPPLYTTGISRQTSIGPPLGTTLTAFPAPPLADATCDPNPVTLASSSVTALRQ